MINIELSKVEESGEQFVVKSNTFEEESTAEELYNTLTDEYADQTLPFFDQGEQLIRLDIVSPNEDDEAPKNQKECYFEYSEALLGSLYNRI
ncbi:hypothetical protein [Salinicoccus albus]|uniref:hypothetical protein n=1 Tax=Salinicoccus albus TaxID=418756 RepID=UPI00037F840D|nr:hypothetical protein [Salinicoccus albus]